MKKVIIGIIVYAVFLFLGGVMGYVKANSLGSIIMGSISSILLLLSAVSIAKNQVLGYFSSIVLTVILTLFFGYRFFASWKMMPAGMMTILGIAMLGLLVYPRLCKTSCHKVVR